MQALDLRRERMLKSLLRDASPLIDLIAEELSLARGSRVTIKVARLVARAVGDVPPVYRCMLREALVAAAREVRDRQGRVWILVDVEAYRKGSRTRVEFYRLIYALDGKYSK
jgi:hypothetical protein